MAAIDFPASPVVGQNFSAPNGVVYQWNGTLWLAQAVSGGVAAPTYDTVNTMLTDTTSFAGANGDTVMQITNGTQMFSRNFTAVDASHPIEVDVSAMIGGGVNQWGALGLFIDGAAAAVAQSTAYIPTANGPVQARLYWQGVLAAGAHTFAVRFGGTGTTYALGSAAARIGGGAQRETMTIREIGIGPQGPQGPAGPSSYMLQSKYAEYTGSTGFTALMPYATNPQITDGSQILSIPFTPQNATSRLRLCVKGTYAGSVTSTGAVGAIFDSRTPGALTSFFGSCFSANALDQMIMEIEVPAVSVAARTYSVRVGPSAAASIYMNGNNSGLVPPSARTTLTIEELSP